MSLCAEILSVGTELLLGNVTNTDARDLSEALSELGINVFWHTVVGDNPARVIDAVNIAKSRADIIITTGGLGPTCDDLTKNALCDAFGLRLLYNEEEGEGLRRYFAERLGSKMTENNLQQAMLPEGCTIFHNLWGTAPGCAFYKDGVHVLMLPGPPHECRAMFYGCAKPYLEALSGDVIRSHQLHVFGMGESAVEDKLNDLMTTLTNPTLAPYAKIGEVMLRVTAKAKSETEAEEMMKPVIEEVKARLGDIVYSQDIETLEETVVKLLTEKKLTVAAAESCTGGLITKRITDIAGASKVLTGGCVTYTNFAKTELCGVDAKLIEEIGPVSAQVAAKMAEGVKARLGSDIGISATGLAGSEGDEYGNPGGTVFVALSAKDGTWVRELHITRDRDRIRTSAASNVLDMVRRYLTGIELINCTKM